MKNFVLIRLFCPQQSQKWLSLLQKCLQKILIHFPDECDFGYFWLVLINMNDFLNQKQLKHPFKNSKTFEGLQTS